MFLKHQALFISDPPSLPGTLPLLFLLLSPKERSAHRQLAGQAWAVVGSYAGEHRRPDWWLNLRAKAAGDIQIGSAKLPVLARETNGVERAQLWSRFVAMYPGYEEYRQRTRRRIPGVILQQR